MPRSVARCVSSSCSPGSGEDHVVLADIVAAAQRREADRARRPRPGDAVAPAHRDLAELRAARRSRRPPQRQRGAGRRIDLVAVVHLHDLDVPVRAEPRRDLLDETQQQVDPETGIGGPDDRDRARGLAHGLFLGAVQPGRADHERFSEPRRERGVLGGGGGRGEFDRDVAAAQQRLGIVGGGDAEPADAGQLAEILAQRRAAGTRDAAGQRAALGRGDIGDQHAADPPGNADDPDPDLRHRRLPLPR